MTQSDFDIILYGGPGAGKGTQAEILVGKLGAVHLNMGRLIREFVASHHPRADEVRSTVESGRLIPTEITKMIADGFLKKVSSGQRVIFDGYPRDMDQVEDLEKLLTVHKRQAKMIYIALPEEAAVRRLTRRAEIEHRADDLDRRAIYNRLRIFHTEAAGLLEHYRSSNRLLEIDGDQSVEEVAQDIAKVV